MDGIGDWPGGIDKSVGRTLNRRCPVRGVFSEYGGGPLDGGTNSDERRADGKSTIADWRRYARLNNGVFDVENGRIDERRSRKWVGVPGGKILIIGNGCCDALCTVDCDCDSENMRGRPPDNRFSSDGISPVAACVCITSNARIKSAIVVFSKTFALLSSVVENAEYALTRRFIDGVIPFEVGGTLKRESRLAGIWSK